MTEALYVQLQSIVNWIGVVGLTSFAMGAVMRSPDPKIVNPKWIGISIKVGIAIIVLAIFLTGVLGFLYPC